MKTLLYLHGFLSSPQSAKAVMMREACDAQGVRFVAPDLNVEPREVLRRIGNVVQTVTDDELLLVGSSLGGFYATCVLAKRPLRAFLINPAVAPWKRMNAYLGEQTVFGSERHVTVRSEYAYELERMSASKLLAPERILILLSSADQVLDWTEARDYYALCHQWIAHGETHRVDHFERYVREAMNFLLAKSQRFAEK